MGCSSSLGTKALSLEQSEIIKLNTPLNPNLQLLPNTYGNEINQYIKRASEILLKFELVRQKIVDEQDYVFLKTGGYIFKQPSPEKCLKYIIYILALKFQGKLNKLNIYCLEDAPFIQISKFDDDNEYQLLIGYITSLSYMKTTLKELENDLPELIFINNEILSDNRDKLIRERKKYIAQGIEILSLMQRFYLVTMSLFRHESFVIYCRKNLYDKQIELIGKNTNFFLSGEGNKNKIMFEGLTKLCKMYKTIFFGIDLENSEEAARKALEAHIEKKKKVTYQ